MTGRTWLPSILFAIVGLAGCEPDPAAVVPDAATETASPDILEDGIAVDVAVDAVQDATETSDSEPDDAVDAVQEATVTSDAASDGAAVADGGADAAIGSCAQLEACCDKLKDLSPDAVGACKLLSGNGTEPQCATVYAKYAATCQGPAPTAFCGDGICDADEGLSTCALDCDAKYAKSAACWTVQCGSVWTACAGDSKCAAYLQCVATCACEAACASGCHASSGVGGSPAFMNFFNNCAQNPACPKLCG